MLIPRQSLKTTVIAPELMEQQLYKLGYVRWDKRYTECKDRRMSLGKVLEDYESVWGATYWRVGDLTTEFKAQFEDGVQKSWNVMPKWQYLWYVEDEEGRGVLQPWNVPVPLSLAGAEKIWKSRWLPWTGLRHDTTGAMPEVM